MLDKIKAFVKGNRSNVVLVPRTDPEGARKEFEFVAEKVEGDAAGEVGEVFEFDFAEGDGLLGTIEDNGAAVGGDLVDKNDLNIGDLERGLVDSDGGVAGGVGVKLDLPGALAFAEGHVATEEEAVDGEGEEESDEKVARQFIRR